MESTPACVAVYATAARGQRGEPSAALPWKPPPEAGRVRGFDSIRSRHIAWVLAAGLAILPWPRAGAAEPALPDTNTPIWRATHGLLLGLARAGTRLVAVGTGGNILLSDDEGANWRAAKSPVDEMLTSVVFPTPTEGWAVGQDEIILHTADSGSTWTQQHVAPDSDQAMFSIISLGGAHLLSTGAYNLTLESYDGVHWKDGKVPDTDDDYHLNCAVARGGDVLVSGESGHAYIRYAGAWTPMKLPYDGSQFACLVGPDGSFWSFGLRGSAFRTEPGAAQWVRVDTGVPFSLFGATNLSDGRMAIVGSNGLVMLLDPATGKASALRPVTDKTLSAVVEGQGGKLIVVGEDGVHLIDSASPQAGADQ